MGAHNVFGWIRDAVNKSRALTLESGDTWGITGNVAITGNQTVSGTLGVTGTLTPSGAVAAGGAVSGTTVTPSTSVILADSIPAILGTGSDVSLQWDGSYLRCGSLMWATAPSPADPNYNALAHQYFNDFMLLTVDYDATNDWALTEDDAACTQAITADATCGELLLTNKATTDDNAQQIILEQQSFSIVSGKKLWFEARIKTAAGATQIDWIAGLINAEDLTGVANNYPANGIVISKLDGAATMILSSTDNGSDTVNTAFGTWDTSYHTVGFYFNGGASGVGTVQAYIDGVATGNAVVVTYETMAKVAPFFMVRNGDGTTTQTMTIDYVKCVQLR